MLKKKNLQFRSPQTRSLSKRLMKGGIKGNDSDFLLFLNDLRNERKFWIILLFSIALTQVHSIALQFDEGDADFLGITLHHWYDWRTWVGVFMFLGSGAFVATFMLLILPKGIAPLYKLPLYVLSIVNIAEMVNIMRDLPQDTQEDDFFWIGYTIAFLIASSVWYANKLIHQSPSEENKILKVRNELLREDVTLFKNKLEDLSKKDLVQVVEGLFLIKYSIPEIKPTSDIEAWKDVLKDITEEPTDKVAEIINEIMLTLKSSNNVN